MDIKSFPIKVEKQEAEKRAQAMGGVLWKVIFLNKKLSEVRKHFVEFKLVTLEIIHKPTVIERMVSKKANEKKQTITLLANGSTGSVSWVDSMPDIIELKEVDSNSIQLSDKDDDYLILKARKLALKVVHRHVGGIPEFKVLKIESVFRPYWIALYGDVAEGNKVRYMPIAADGCGSHRSM
ncbi:hypothetical protein CLRAG_15480 [Clostridium ragsdalei P11]|uniref:Uncharacterized protein n=1 Tax=Clostridium ragsdalei P11 TaxID=1353534 RepID=A0A1A6AWC0_9CLOT|nr:hypothetical protein [Clostridium ragsdalei]OBR94381.1 hypothetical protein CLRAG_15480 [Clostridium ragsdalei P11]